MCPCLGGHIGAAPTSGTVKASDDKHFGAHSRSFGTCSPTLRASCCHSRARLASGWLAGLYREGVEPSGSLRKVSDHMTILLSCSPDATQIAADLLQRPSRQPRATSGHGSGCPRNLGRSRLLRKAVGSLGCDGGNSSRGSGARQRGRSRRGRRRRSAYGGSACSRALAKTMERPRSLRSRGHLRAWVGPLAATCKWTFVSSAAMLT